MKRLTDEQVFQALSESYREEAEMLAESIERPNPPEWAVEMLKKAIAENVLKRELSLSEGRILLLHLLTKAMTAADLMERLDEQRVSIKGLPSQLAILQMLDGLTAANLLSREKPQPPGGEIPLYTTTAEGKAFLGEMQPSVEADRLRSLGLLAFAGA